MLSLSPAQLVAQWSLSRTGRRSAVLPFIPCISQFQDQVIGFIKDCIALTMDEAKANLNNEQFDFYKKILTQKRKEIKEKIEKEMNLAEN